MAIIVPTQPGRVQYAGPLVQFGDTGGFQAPLPPQQTFRQALVAKLQSIVELSGLPIYPGMIPETHDLQRDGPAISFNVQSYPAGSVLSGSDGTYLARVQLSAWSYQLSQSDQIQRSIFNAIMGLYNDSSWGNGTVIIMSVSQAEELDLTEAVQTGTDIWIHQIPAEFNIKHRVAIPTHT